MSRIQLEDISEGEYDFYICRLKKKDINKMDYDELVDLSAHAISEGDAKLSIRLLILAMNFAIAKAELSKELFIRIAKYIGKKDGINILKELGFGEVEEE